MKVLAASDIHADDTMTEAIIDEANSGEYDLFLSAGDYVSRNKYEQLMNPIDIPKIACTGNWDFQFSPPDNDEFEHLFNYMKIDFSDYKIALIGAVFPEDFIDDITDWMDGTPNEKRIIMSHYPPKRVADQALNGNHAGMDGFRKLVLKAKPALWLCGHIHEAFGQYSLMKTTVLNTAVDESRKCFSIDMTDEGVSSVSEVDLS